MISSVISFFGGLTGHVSLDAANARGRLALSVVTPSRGGVDESTGDSRDQEGIGDSELNSMVQWLVERAQHAVELGSLSDRSRETIQDETGQLARAIGSHLPVGAILVLLELLLDHTDHNVVTDQSSSIHNLLGGLSELGLSRDLRPQHVTGSEMADAVLFGNVRSLRSLSYIFRLLGER